MNRDPRIRLPWAGLLIIFVAPLATLMVIVPSLFVGGVQKVEREVPAIISRLAPNPSPHDHAPRAPGLPPVAQAAPPAPAAAPAAPAPSTASGAVPPVGQAAPVPTPVAAPSATTVQTATVTPKTGHGRKRRRRPHQDLDS